MLTLAVALLVGLWSFAFAADPPRGAAMHQHMAQGKAPATPSAPKMSKQSPAAEYTPTVRFQLRTQGISFAGIGGDIEGVVNPTLRVMVGMGLAVATFWGTPAALASGRPGIATSAVAYGVLVNAALLALVPGQGPTGAAIALLGGYAAYTVAISVWLARTVMSDPGSRTQPPSLTVPTAGG